MIDLEIEFTGAARAITGLKTLPLTLAEGTTYRQIIGQLRQIYPELVGAVIDPNDDLLLSATLFNVNGKDIILPDRMHECPKNGDRLVFLYLIVGG